MANNANQTPALFSTFVMGLASAAFMEMGVIEDPHTKKKEVRLEASRQYIDLLMMLEEKTRGNLSSEEKELLTQVLTDLRFQFAKLSAEKSK